MTNLSPLTKEQLNLLFKPEPFALLRKAKQIISVEFSKELSLHSKDILKSIHDFSTESKDQELTNISIKLQTYVEIDSLTMAEVVIKAKEGISETTSEPTLPTTPVTSTTTSKLAKIKAGDIVDGKRCSGFYRGQPVFD